MPRVQLKNKVTEDEDWVIIGRFGRVHGIKGFINVHSFTDPKENMLHYQDWHIKIEQQWQSINLLEIKEQNNRFMASIEGYEDREKAASRLTNREIAVKRQQLPELGENEYYWHDLLGLSVVNQKNIPLGEVTNIMPTGANDVLVVTGEKQHLLPYLPEKVILQVDLKEQKILVDWDEDF